MTEHQSQRRCVVCGQSVIGDDAVLPAHADCRGKSMAWQAVRRFERAIRRTPTRETR